MLDAANPFTPPPTSSEPPPEARNFKLTPRTTPRSVAVSLALWTFVCVISAAPSFAWGLGTIARDQLLAMGLGIGVFVGLYTWADQFTQRLQWRQKAAIALTLKIGYITRVMISVIFPIGAGLDLFCGLMSVALVEALLPNLRTHPGGAADIEGSVGFGGAFIITLVQGITLNIVLLGYMSVVLAIVLAIRAYRPPQNAGATL